MWAGHRPGRLAGVPGGDRGRGRRVGIEREGRRHGVACAVPAGVVLGFEAGFQSVQVHGQADEGQGGAAGGERGRRGQRPPARAQPGEEEQQREGRGQRGDARPGERQHHHDAAQAGDDQRQQPRPGPRLADAASTSASGAASSKNMAAMVAYWKEALTRRSPPTRVGASLKVAQHRVEEVPAHGLGQAEQGADAGAEAEAHIRPVSRSGRRRRTWRTSSRAYTPDASRARNFSAWPRSRARSRRRAWRWPGRPGRERPHASPAAATRLREAERPDHGRGGSRSLRWFTSSSRAR